MPTEAVNLDDIGANPESFDLAALSPEQMMALAEGRTIDVGSDGAEAPAPASTEPADPPAPVEEPAEPPPPAEQPAASKPAVEPEPPAEPSPAPADSRQPATVIKGEGGTEIPYAVLKDTRQELHQVRAELEELRRQKAAEPAGEQPDGGGAGGDKAETLAERLARMRDDYEGDLVDVLDETRARLEELEQREHNARAAAEANQQELTQQAIDQIPELAKWQTENSELWQRAVVLDDALAGTPAWADRPEIDRFRHIVQSLGGSVGDSPAPAPAATPKAPTSSQEDAAIEAALQRADEAAAPGSLADIPGGAGEGTQQDRLAEMSTTELAASFASGDIDKTINELLRTT